MEKLYPAMPLVGGYTYAPVRFANTAIRWWVSAVKAGWDLLSYVGERGTVGRYPLPHWLRQDLGLTDGDVTSHSDHIDETRQKYGWWC